MLIAVPYDNGEIFWHFGRTQYFKFYYIENKDIIQTQIISTNGQGHGALASLLASANVDIVICGGMGKGMRDAMLNRNIDVYPGVTGYADDAVDAMIDGILDFNPGELCGCSSDHEHDKHLS